jgi:hypothetical protein
MAGRRSGAGQHAERINAAADLAAAGLPPAEAARVLAGRFAVSARQARRYIDQAAAGGRVEVPDARVVFTVKLPAALAGRVRAYAREHHAAISAVVARALAEFLDRGHRDRPGG